MNSPDNSAICHTCLRYFAILATVLALNTTYTEAGTRQQKPKPTVEAGDLAKRMHALINKERKRHGLVALAWSDDLSRIATQHSRDMATRNYLSHNSPEGKGFPERYHRAGFVCEVRIGTVIYTGAENIALSHLYNSMTTENGTAYYNWNSVQEIVQRTVDGWMNSPGHRQNILTPYWRREGIGIEIERDSGSKIYITQNFC